MPPDDDLLGRINAVDLEHVLGEIQTDRGNLRKVSLNTAIISLLEEALAAWPPGAVDPNAVAARVLLNSLDDAVVAKLIEIVQKDLAAKDYDESDERPGKEIMKGHIRERSSGHWAIVIEVRDLQTDKCKRLIQQR